MTSLGPVLTLDSFMKGVSSDEEDDIILHEVSVGSSGSQPSKSRKMASKKSKQEENNQGKLK